MTYATFLGIFVALPCLLLALALRTRLTRRWWAAILLICAIALVYTTPWDHLIIAQGVWSYPPGRVFGWAVGLVPLEEVAFYGLQVLLTSLLVAPMMKHDAGGDTGAL